MDQIGDAMPPDPPERAGLFRFQTLIGIFLVLVLMVAAVWFGWSWLGGRGAPPPDLWTEASYTPDPECEAGSPECPVLLSPWSPGHGGTVREGDVVLSAVSYPQLNDPIAQWGRCVDTVLSCLGPAPAEADFDRAGALRECVAASACPQACRDRYEARASGDLERAVSAFRDTFLSEDAWCAPVQ